jgi:predicted aspartyl protease
MLTIDLETTICENRISTQEITSMNFSRRYEFMICTGYDGYKLMDPETLEVINSFRTNFRMNCAQISPLMSTKMGNKPHIIMGGGVQARDTAMAKVNFYIAKILIGRWIGYFLGKYNKFQDPQ